MKSSQINFFMMPQDVAELDNYLKQNGWVIIADRMPTGKICLLDSLENQQSLYSYISKSDFLQQIQLKYINNYNYYKVDVLESAVIEYRKSLIQYDNKLLKLGRLYYNKEKTDKANCELLLKDELFLKNAELLFKWLKKTINNTKTNNHCYTSPRALQFANNEQFTFFTTY